MKILVALIVLVISAVLKCAETSVYLHGLNADINSPAYQKFFNELKTRGPLITPILPGHTQKNDLSNLNQAEMNLFFNNLMIVIANNESPENTTIYAHSMGAILFKNYVPAEIRNKMKKIIYFSPGVPPKYYGVFKWLVQFLPNSFNIPSYSPKELRLNDGLPVSSYEFLFNEIEQFKNNSTLLPNEEIRIHEKDEVVDVNELKKTFPSIKMNNTAIKVPYHVYFLD